MLTSALLLLGLSAVPLSLDLNGFSAELDRAHAQGGGPGGGPGGGGPGGGPGDGSGGAFEGRGLGEVFGGMFGGGQARGQAMAAGRERYNRALGASPARHPMQGDRAAAEPAFVFSDDQAEAVMRAGWINPRVMAAGPFANHGKRVSTYVGIAKALGHPAHVGALQANFRTDDPGTAPGGDWRQVDLDVNCDGVVDQDDLQRARQQ